MRKLLFLSTLKILDEGCLRSLGWLSQRRRHQIRKLVDYISLGLIRFLDELSKVFDINDSAIIEKNFFVWRRTMLLSKFLVYSSASWKVNFVDLLVLFCNFCSILTLILLFGVARIPLLEHRWRSVQSCLQLWAIGTIGKVNFLRILVQMTHSLLPSEFCVKVDFTSLMTTNLGKVLSSQEIVWIHTVLLGIRGLRALYIDIDLRLIVDYTILIKQNLIWIMLHFVW